MYRTGDQARWLLDGNIEFLGRNDFQVKIRGFRIELGEIEARLIEYPAVREAAVIAREDILGDKRLAAYYTTYTTAGPSVPDPEQLRSHLSASLPEYMVPAAYVLLDTLPLTPSGKLDRKALRAPDSGSYLARGYETPQGEIETRLATIWSNLLKQEKIGRNDNFFALGGHSLLAVQMVLRLQRLLNSEVMLNDLFTHPTVAALAAQIEGRSERTGKYPAICMRRGNAPLFLAHCGSGELLYVSTLAPHIETGPSVYGLPSQSVDESPLESVDAMAARLARMVRAAQPFGPYRLAGWSFGGTLAYEMARQLMATGEEIDFLGLLDTVYFAGIPDSHKYHLEEEFNDKECLLEVIRTSAEIDEKLSPLIRKIEGIAPAANFPDLLLACRQMSLIPGYLTTLAPEQIRQRLQHIHAYRKAAIQYRAPAIPAPIHLFTAADGDAKNPFLGWDAVLPARGIEIIPAAGTHQSMVLDPNAKSLAQLLSRSLNKAVLRARA